MRTFSRPYRRWGVAAAAIAVMAAPTFVLQPASAAVVSTKASVIAPEVQEQMATAGRAPFWVVLRDHADLSRFKAEKNKAAQGTLVYQTLTRLAADAQAGLRQLLTKRGAEFQPYWIANTIRVVGDSTLLDELARRPEVKRIDADPVDADEASAAADQMLPARPAVVPPPVDGVEWNIHRIGADQAWKEFGTRGEGIVVSNIDSGVMQEHPALTDNYRGRNSNGTIDNSYNWFDGSANCTGPCDSAEHGTHVMGIAVGRAADGSNQIGVAPGARWIAAGAWGTAARLAAAQWLLAPTDSNGANPRPDLAPDVVNSSWTDTGGSMFGDVLDAFVAAGIFPVFAAGNSGSNGCSTVTLPASFDAAYTVANATADNTIASDSGRGPTADGQIKPNISAPGTAIRSSSVTREFAVRDGTSEAAPHVAGAVALLWSAIPELDGDVAATRKLLGDTAKDIDDTACGGTAGNNNAAGEGLVDIVAALRAAPHGKGGSLTGTARRSDTAATVADVNVELTGPRTKNLKSDARGAFGLAHLLPGTYSYRASAFGYRDTTGTVAVQPGANAALEVGLTPLATVAVSGVVSSAEGPVAGATIAVDNSSVLTETDQDGRYQLPLPVGSYQLTVQSPSRCALPDHRTLDVMSDVTLDVTLDPLTDLAGFGHTCTRPTVDYQQGTTKLDLKGSEETTAEVSLPFPVGLYDKKSSKAWISSLGYVCLGRPSNMLPHEALWELPNFSEPTSAVMPFYSLLDVDDKAGVYTTMSTDQIVVEWRNVVIQEPNDREREGRISISLVIRPDGTFTVNYRDVGQGWYVGGRNALIGLQDSTGSDAFVYAGLASVVSSGLGFTIHPPQ